MEKEKEFYSDLNSNVLTENITFSIKPFISYRTNKTSKITLIEKERFIQKIINLQNLSTNIS